MPGRASRAPPTSAIQGRRWRRNRPSSRAAGDEVAEHELSLREHALAGRAAGLAGAFAARQVGQHRRALTGRPLDRRADEPPELDLRHPGLGPGPSPRAGRRRIARARRGAARPRPRSLIARAAPNAPVASTRESAPTSAAGSEPSSAARRRPSAAAASARAAPPTGSSGPVVKPSVGLVEAAGGLNGAGLVRARHHDRRAVGCEHRKRRERERALPALHVDLEAGDPGDRGRIGREHAVGAEPARRRPAPAPASGSRRRQEDLRGGGRLLDEDSEPFRAFCQLEDGDPVDWRRGGREESEGVLEVAARVGVVAAHGDATPNEVAGRH